MTVTIGLTPDQLRQLEPLFEAVRKGNHDGVPSVIVAQIWPVGLTAKRLCGEEAAALQKALGGSGHKSSPVGECYD